MNFKRILLISRPMMWPWTALMYLVGVGTFSNLSFLAVVELFFFTLPLNFYLYGLNDIYDTRSDRINERKTGAQGVAPEDHEIKLLNKLVWIPAFLFLIVSLISGNWEHVILSLGFIVLSFTYSHAVTRVKELPILDCFNSASIYCIPGLIAYSLHASVSALPLATFLIILPYAGMHAITTLVDTEVDKQAGMITIGVALGKRGATIFMLAMFSLALYIFQNNILLVSIFSVSMLLGVIFLFAENKADDRYFRFAAPAVLISFAMVAMTYFILQANSVLY